MERFLNSGSLDSAEITTALSISTPSEWNALSDRLLEIEKRWPRHPVDLLGGEETDDRLSLSHLALSVDNRVGEDLNYLELELIYSQLKLTKRIPARRRRKLQDDAASVKSTLSLLEEFFQESQWHCNCHWTFNPDLITPVIQLPLLRVQVPGTHLNEISGVRFTDPLRSEFVILDLVGPEELHMTANFTFHQTFVKDIIDTVVARGEVIRDAFISPREGKEE